MFKHFLIIFSMVLMSGIMSLFPSSSYAANSGCCVLTIPVQIKGRISKDITYQAPTKAEHDTSIKDAAACRKAAQELSWNNRRWSFSSSYTSEVKRTFWSSDIDTQCKQTGQTSALENASAVYGSSYCCVRGKSIVESIKAGASTLALGGLLYTDPYAKDKANGTLGCTPQPQTKKSCDGNLEKRACHTVSACIQSQQAYKQTLDNAQTYKKQLDDLKKQILETPVPKLGTQFPGGQPLSNIEVIPGDGSTDKANNSGITYIGIPWIAQLIRFFYRYAIGIGGIVATVMIMIGGFMWILSGGDAGRVSQAKQYIKNASLGLVLLMTAYMILNFINPDLVNLRSIYIEIPSIAVQTGNFPECQPAVSDPKVKTINGQFYCGQFDDPKQYKNLVDEKASKTGKADLSNVIPPGKSIAYVTHGLYNSLKGANAALVKMDKDYLAKNPSKDKNKPYFQLRISSASRSLTTQGRLCNCWKSYEASGFKTCPSGCGACNKALTPTCKSTGHKTGQAIDVTLIGPGLTCGPLSMAYNCASHISKTGNVQKILAKENKCKDVKYKTCQDKLYSILKSNNFKGINIEWWHFNNYTK